MDATRQGVIRWSAHRAHQHLQAVIPASIGIPVAALILGQFIALPKNPTTTDRITQGVESLIAGVLIVALLVLIYAIVVAPYEQRNALRRRLTNVAGSLGESRWAEQRRDIYARYLTAVHPWIVRIRYWEGPYFDRDATTESLRAEDDPFDFRAVHEAMTGPEQDIALMGSKEAESAVKSLGAQLLAFEALYVTNGSMEELQMMAKECEKRYVELKVVFRKDLGIASAEPINEHD